MWPYFEGEINLIFLPVWCVFSLESIGLRASGSISSISYGFGDELNHNKLTKIQFQNLNFLIFLPILMQLYAINFTHIWPNIT